MLSVHVILIVLALVLLTGHIFKKIELWPCVFIIIIDLIVGAVR